MKLVRKMAVSLVVWATAASTLLATTPHFVCRCVDGTSKFAPYNSDSPTTSCCTAKSEGGCCGEANPKNATTKHSCCGQQQNEAEPVAVKSDNAASSNAEGPQLGNSQCQKRLVKVADRVMSRHIAQADDVLKTQVSLPACGSSCILPPVVLLEHGILQVNSPPPPSDLIISLQHLVI